MLDSSYVAYEKFIEDLENIGYTRNLQQTKYPSAILDCSDGYTILFYCKYF